MTDTRRVRRGSEQRESHAARFDNLPGALVRFMVFDMISSVIKRGVSASALLYGVALPTTARPGVRQSM
jgi:hypothetical protein